MAPHVVPSFAEFQFMKIYSYYRKGIELEPVEIEMTLAPGMPQFQVTGLPDICIKESMLRIKTALRNQGFQLPQREQVVFHLRPTYERKSSQGLDLALAALYLWKTGQIPLLDLKENEKIFLYGELGLDGQVTRPEDLDLLDELEEHSYLVTGKDPGKLGLPHFHGQISQLTQLEKIDWVEANFDALPEPTISSDSHLRFCTEAADVLAVAAAGEHNIFLAGPAGSGKTTFSRALHGLLRGPNRAEWRRIQKMAKLTNVPAEGRPLVAPHHTASMVALVGGGVPASPGEISRAQHGILLLDEYLEFDPKVLEALREPIERHLITVLRQGIRTTFPADFMLLATSNLCPCGDYVPRCVVQCSYSQFRCRSYYQRLSGPLLDRFEVATYTHLWSREKSISLEEVFVRVRRAQKFAEETRNSKTMNSRLAMKDIENTIPEFIRTHLMPELPASQRRRQALLRVARTFADLDESKEVKSIHLERAKEMTIDPFNAMKQAFI